MISLKEESRLLSLLGLIAQSRPPFSSEWGIATWRNFVWQDSLKCLLCLLWIFCTLCLYFDHFITDMIHLSLNKNLIIMCEVTCKRLYIPFCQSVGLSVGPSIGPSIQHKKKQPSLKKKSCFQGFVSWQIRSFPVDLTPLSENFFFEIIFG